MAEATPYTVHITPENVGLWKAKQTDGVAKKASELLQEDLEKHHVFFNEDGFHNHIPHHILALYGTGADVSSIQRGYDNNKTYQRPVLPTHDRVLRDLQSWEKAQDYLGKEAHYPDFLRFFQREMDTRGGWEPVVAEYLFREDDAADDMLVRLFSGFLHPLIQLMYGMEWRQPSIVAEALAQAAVHGNDIGIYLLEAERLAKVSSEDDDDSVPPPSIVNLLQAVHDDEKLAGAAKMSDANKVRDGVLVRAREEILRIASRVRVRPDELEERTAEMFNACVYMASSAAMTMHPPKQPKFDFFLIHHVNASPIFPTINAQSWIPPTVKARLLEWKIRMDLVQYAGRAVPPLALDKIASYRPNSSDVESNAAGAGAHAHTTILRLHNFPDDGHAIKLGRAALLCRDICKTYEDRGWMAIKGDELWDKVYHLIVDSVEAPGPNWVRTCGMEEAWENVPDAPGAKL